MGITQGELHRILAQNLSRLTCLLKGESVSSGFIPTYGGSDTATIQNSANVTTISEPNIREFNVVVAATTSVSIKVTKSDGSTFTHLFEGSGVYYYTGQVNQAPITEIEVTELDNTSTLINVNYSSLG
ncbi:MAG: hypothetical protein J5I47_04655 [Vicingus serpentipes]|nr:hypothetical protein [Vicingus serpentipes]